MRSALLAFLWVHFIPGSWLPRRGWRGRLACLCWRESVKREGGMIVAPPHPVICRYCRRIL